MSGLPGVGRNAAKRKSSGFSTVGWEQTMVMTVAGPPLTKSAGAAQPRHAIPGPGPNALKMFPGNDVTTWLVSTGVIDCAILTIVLATTGPGGMVIGGHRPGLFAPWHTSIPSAVALRARRRSRRCS